MSLTARAFLFAALPLACLLFVASASAQLPKPPSTVHGSITDAEGEVPAGVKIEAYVGNNLCGESQTVYTGEGSARVTVYVVDVVSDDQTDGCGEEGDAVRIRVGDRLSPKAAVWEAGLVRLDVIFGDNITPKPIPTFTPTAIPSPTRPGETTTGTPQPSGTNAANLTRTPSATGTGTSTTDETPGVTSSTPAPPSAGDDDDGGGFPLWGTVLLALLGVGLVGAGAGLYISRQNGAGAP